MKKVYLYKKFERFWHWSQTLLITVLIFTGFEIHGTTNIIGYESAVNLHNIAAWAFLVLIVFAIFWHVTTDEWRQYMPTLNNMKAQLDYYLIGIFNNAPHPVKKRTLSKLNPLQRVTYFALKVIIIPAMVISGLLYMYYNDAFIIFEIENLDWIAWVHTLGAYLLLTFLIVHIYLITTGHTLTSNLSAMVTGWETVDDDEVKELVEEAIEETGLKIKVVNDNPEEHQKLKNLVVKAMKETEDKVNDDKLKGQKEKKNKKNKK
ncbi:MAG: cytochrome B [Marinilabiliales bacterium]|nr:MAG: cytochrome B [Marinilabiliales bacterium]